MISIIVPIRFRPDLTEVCIDSILKYTKGDYEIILVQEGEDEEITKLCQSYVSENVVFTQNKIPKGYAGALNTGMNLSIMERNEVDGYYCFMNNDTVVTPGWMDEMMLAFNEPEVGLVSPTFWGMGNRQSVDWNNGEQFDFVIDPFSLCGVCYLISKECIDKIGIWDEQFGHGGEDFDITIRVSNAGYRMAIARKSFIYHYGGASTRELFGSDLKKVMANQNEKLELLNKKYPELEIWSKFKTNG
jgi:GT2 family glycosyltransferase